MRGATKGGKPKIGPKKANLTMSIPEVDEEQNQESFKRDIRTKLFKEGGRDSLLERDKEIIHFLLQKDRG